MVGFNNTTETKEKNFLAGELDVDIVCPQCGVQLGWFRPWLIDSDRYGREIRKYYGWCGNCDTGYVVIQFKEKYDRWIIHKYCYAIDVSDGTGVLPSTQWQTVNELPDPKAAVMLGPGGDYDKPVSIEEMGFDMMDKLLKPMRKVVRVLEQLKKLRDSK